MVYNMFEVVVYNHHHENQVNFTFVLMDFVDASDVIGSNNQCVSLFVFAYWIYDF